MTLRGQSPDALQAIEALRDSDKFGQVDLKGSVNRDRSGTEKFTVIIKLKNHENHK